jgi:glycine cleavage system H protein
MVIPKNLYYTKNHLWLRKIGLFDFCIGITDFAQKEIGEIDLIEIELEGKSIKKDEIWGRVYGTNQTFALRAPFDCKIIAANITLDKSLPQINTNPYRYWFAIVSVKTDNNTFLSDQEYIKLI